MKSNNDKKTKLRGILSAVSLFAAGAAVSISIPIALSTKKVNKDEIKQQNEELEKEQERNKKLSETADGKGIVAKIKNKYADLLKSKGLIDKSKTLLNSLKDDFHVLESLYPQYINEKETTEPELLSIKNSIFNWNIVLQVPKNAPTVQEVEVKFEEHVVPIVREPDEIDEIVDTDYFGIFDDIEVVYENKENVTFNDASASDIKLRFKNPKYSEQWEITPHFSIEKEENGFRVSYINITNKKNDNMSFRYPNGETKFLPASEFKPADESQN
ncbi:hypothetical protein [Mycoplasma sp. HS2188]|uniref:hypothetical protein n=1 Tax=Mycoplasma sp. HS2188 TaxID=2976765 RepID=UPI0021AADC2A|nr:hypothetical protein [Mycoplasma sp. HS2188]MCT4469669.1 hypothetical protein [Mycoplasma sp. HS2188]